MKIAILILAHSNPDQLGLLVDSLKNDFEIFIHLDKKSKVSPDRFLGDKNVHVIKKYKVFWGSYNQIRATHELLQWAYNQHCDYFLLISGFDFPLKTNGEIIARIEADPQTNYLSYARLPKADWALNGGLDRLQLFWENKTYFHSHTFFNRFCNLGRKIQKKLNLRRKLYPIPLYGDVNWVNLSRETVSYLLQFVETHPDYMKSFRHTLSADEIWVQSVVMNSPYAQNTVNDSKRYVDWVKGPDYPRVLDASDYEKMRTSDAFFARKVTLDSLRQFNTQNKIHHETNIDSCS